jgi:hypothetical protein
MQETFELRNENKEKVHNPSSRPVVKVEDNNASSPVNMFREVELLLIL